MVDDPASKAASDVGGAETTMYQPARTRVVAGALRRQGRVLIIQRANNASRYPLLWEVPGGKVEVDERDEEALQRELREELDLHVEEASCRRAFVTHLDGLQIDFTVFEPTPLSRESQLREGQHDYRWFDLRSDSPSSDEMTPGTAQYFAYTLLSDGQSQRRRSVSELRLVPHLCTLAHHPPYRSHPCPAGMPYSRA